MNWINVGRYKRVSTKESGRKYDTNEVIMNLSLGEKAWVLNHVGYKSYLSKDDRGNLLWKVDEGEYAGYCVDFYIVDQEDWNTLEWFIEIQ